MKRLRLLHVIVEAHYVIDDGDTLTAATAQAITVKPSDWPDFPAFLEAERAAEEQRINAPSVTAEPWPRQTD